MDDGSTDGTPAVLAELAARDGRVRLFRHESSAGLTRSLNELLSQAKAPIVARIDCGDFAHRGRFAAQLSAFQDASIALVASDFWLLTAEGKRIGRIRPPTASNALAAALGKSNILAHSSLTVRTQTLRETGGFAEEFICSQDYELILRMMRRGELLVLPQALCAMRLSPGGITFRNGIRQEYYAALARHRHLGTPMPEGNPNAEPVPAHLAEANYCERVGRSFLVKGNMSAARTQLFRAWKAEPTNAVRIFQLCAAGLPGWIYRAFRIAAKR